MSVEFSRPMGLDRIPVGGLEQLVEATPAECAAIAARLKVPAVASLSCRFRLTPESGMIRAEGQLRAEFTRICVVSLDEFGQAAAEEFRVRFVPAGSEADDDPESEDELPYSAGLIDLGEVAVEQLALILDPYPHKPGAALPEGGPEAEEQPFAALARLRPPG